MADVTVVSRPSTEGKRLTLVLTEDRVGHYPEFRDYFARVFDLDRIGLAEPGYVRSPSGRIYALVFIGRSGEPFPSGLEVYIVVDALEPIDEIAVDNDLWAILEWMITGVGDPWTVSDLQETGVCTAFPRLRPGSSPRQNTGANIERNRRFESFFLQLRVRVSRNFTLQWPEKLVFRASLRAMAGSSSITSRREKWRAMYPRRYCRSARSPIPPEIIESHPKSKPVSGH